MAAGALLFSGYYFVDRRYGMPTDLVVGFRLFVPLLPVMVLGYAVSLRKALGQRITGGWTSAVVVVLLMLNAVLVARHQGFLLDTAKRT